MLAHVFFFSNSTACPAAYRLRLCAASLALTLPAPKVLHAFVAGLVAVTVSVISVPVSAAEWFVTPALKLSYEQDDNIRMTLQPHDTVRGSVITPRVEMGVQSDAWGITGLAEVARKRYSEDPDLDRDFETFSLASLYKTERNTFTLNAYRANEATIAGELDDPDIGRTTVQTSRRTETVQPSWTWLVTERAKLQLSYELSEVFYVDGESSGLYDYQNRALTTTWSYLLSPRTQFFLTGSYSKYRVPSLSFQSQLPTTPQPFSVVQDVDSRTQGLRAGFGHSFSETMQGKLILGRRKTSTERTVSDCGFIFIFPVCGSPELRLTDNTGTTLTADLTKKFERLGISVNASRDTATSGTGTVVEWDVVGINFDYPITARLKSSLTANGSESRRISGTVNEADNLKQYTLQPALQWQWTPEAELSISYRYWHLERETEDRPVHSRAIYLALNYQWARFSISR